MFSVIGRPNRVLHFEIVHSTVKITTVSKIVNRQILYHYSTIPSIICS